ncbi:hypothetical protein AXF42_Ash008146 [Apostasia shenzhenica]|uniref:Exocyst subunit Exo70 family protein n=1 Tax=Apostasia shenzhenica TaxID=1088818 RepID=A0A2I0A8Q2_9ASPA|nr:hypothetical protein AXF42_Ash008146 [Apostasia shenzhenica]
MGKGEMRIGFPFSRRRARTSGVAADDGQARGTNSILENLATAEDVVAKWGTNSSTEVKQSSSLFSAEGRADVPAFLRAVGDLQITMLFYSSANCDLPEDSCCSSLVRAQTLMQSAIHRLEQEFQLILCSNKDGFEMKPLAGGGAADDLQSIAEIMIANGYGRDCVRAYEIHRKTIVDDGLRRLCFDLPSQSQIKKLKWELLEHKICSWIAGARTAVGTLFTRERLLCDHVFAGFDSAAESCFSGATLDAALRLVAFPEAIAKAKLSPEKLFRILDLFEAVAVLSPELESVFSPASTSAVVAKAGESLRALAKSARCMLAGFEAAVQKFASDSPVIGGAVHPLARYAMNYLCFLADYTPTLADIFANDPFRPPKPLPEESLPSHSQVAAAPEVAERLAWVLLILLCKLDLTAGAYSDISLSYLFLANNLRYVVNKVRRSGLIMVLGEEWAERQEAKATRYAEKYVKLGWGSAAAAVPVPEEESPVPAALEEFNRTLEEACRRQKGWVVADDGMRKEVRAVVEAMILPAYQGAYRRCLAACGGQPPAAAAAPEDLRAQLAKVFSGSDFGSSPGSSVAPI